MDETRRTTGSKWALRGFWAAGILIVLLLAALVFRSFIAEELYSQAKRAAAEDDLRRAISRANAALFFASDGQVLDILYIRAGFKEAARDWEGAIADFTRIIRRDPAYKHHSGHLGRGLCFKRLNRWDEAVADFAQALSDDLSHAFARFQLGTAFEGKGDRPSAIEQYEQSLTEGGLAPVFRREVEERLQRLR